VPNHRADQETFQPFMPPWQWPAKKLRGLIHLDDDRANPPTLGFGHRRGLHQGIVPMTRTSANLVLLLAALFWGAGNVAQQTVLAHIGPLAATGFKSLIAAIVILPYCVTRARPVEPLGAKGVARGLAVILSFAAASTLMQIAYGLTSVTNAGFLVNTSTVLTPIFAWLLLGHRVGAIIGFAALATFSGALLMSGGHLGALGAGDILCLASAAAYALWMVFLAEFVTHHGRAGALTLAQFGATALICLPWSVATEAPALAAITAALPELLFIGVVSTAAGYLLQAIAQSHTSASEAAVIVSAEAIFGAMGAWLLLGETLDGARALGALLIIGGILLVQMPPASFRRRLPPIPAPGE
jgi:drug/metabolite transporter (DMT)-like permease